MSDQPPVASRESRAQVRTMLLIGAVASIFGIALALWIDWFPVPASEQAGPIDTLWDVLLIASVPIFVLVPDQRVRRRLCVIWGIQPIPAEIPRDTDEMIQRMDRALLERGLAKEGQAVVAADNYFPLPAAIAAAERAKLE